MTDREELIDRLEAWEPYMDEPQITTDTLAEAAAALTAMQAEIERLKASLTKAVDAAVDLAAERDAALAQVEAIRPLVVAARGLSFGEDWNSGAHALTHGYRAKLLTALPDALAALRDTAPAAQEPDHG